MQGVLSGRVIQGGGGGDGRVKMQVGGARQRALRRGAGRLLGADEVAVVVMMVMVVEVAVRVGGGVPQRHDVATTGRQGRLSGGQVGAGPAQRGGLPRQRCQDDGIAVEQGRRCSLQDELSALDALILITLEHDIDKYVFVNNSEHAGSQGQLLAPLSTPTEPPPTM